MISANLEYLMSSLPALSFQNTETVQRKVYAVLETYAGSKGKERNLIDILDEEARKYLSDRSYRMFQRLRLDRIYLGDFQNSSSRLLTDFSCYDAYLRQETARLREARRTQSNGVSAPVSALITPGDPLQEELQLMRLRWNRIEELLIGHYADLDALVGYKLKLMILMRRWSFDAGRGALLFQQLTKATKYAGQDINE